MKKYMRKTTKKIRPCNKKSSYNKKRNTRKTMKRRRQKGGE